MSQRKWDSLNDTDRAEWVQSDEPLYRWFRDWQKERRRDRKSASIREFVREFRTDINLAVQSRQRGAAWG